MGKRPLIAGRDSRAQRFEPRLDWRAPDDATELEQRDLLDPGDAGYVDEDGFVYVTDRIKDLIISAGENIYPAELERVLVQHEGLADVAVIGIPDDRWGEVPIAVVVRRPGVTLTKADVMSYARKHLASCGRSSSPTRSPETPAASS